MQWAETCGPVALVGSGEYLESMASIEGELIAGRAKKYVQLATAATPDGPEVVAKWERLGVAQAKRLGVEVETIAVYDSDSANSSEIAEKVKGAGLIYLSGGHPTFLADTLRDSLVWQQIVAEWKSGAALAGCSAGAMVMSTWVPSVRNIRHGGVEGLNVVENLRIIPHFDAYFSKLPDLFARFGLDRSTETTVIGIDEETALVGGPIQWSVKGRGSVWILSKHSKEEFRAGSTIELS
jgi:cyanophycinase